jgi:hypothetical protein
VKENKPKSILFICGSLERGKDGVGDYTRLLANSLASSQQISTYIVALNDRFVSDDLFIEEQQNNTPVLRFNASYSYQKRYPILDNYVKRISPDVVSLQFVPYAFQNKGIPIALISLLPKLAVRKWHIMFHELWIGMEKSANIKAKLIGLIQQKLIAALIKRLQPIKINTSNDLYVAYLSLITKQQATILPLFSNIEIAKKSDSVNDKKNNAQFNVVLFGAIQPKAPIKPFVNWLINELLTSNRKPVFTFVGNNGVSLNEWKSALKSLSVESNVFSRQSENKIAELLQSANLGITTTPYLLADKSGAVAAINQAGVPALCVSREWVPNVASNLLKQIRVNNVIQWHSSLELTQVINYAPEVSSLNVVAIKLLKGIS